ncbi:hypothetical protein L6164_037236 [Bauhinia variegata]|uniref:Uncharacterized protein n=1 Tax=Bauhinia variegata TaxID=167791 RepID=A0ACB9KK87_BAUVA|nr:hypothetical protein L6164_037236 [Bauhinia variegata]
MGFSRMSMLLLLLVCSMIAIVAAQTKPGCNSTCGDLNIPYPFGTTEGCYYNNDEKFKIDCYSFANGTFMANSSGGNSRVLNISTDDGELHGTTWVASLCFDSFGNPVSSDNMSSFWLGNFNIYNSKNKLYVVGDKNGYRCICKDGHRGKLLSFLWMPR